MFQCIRETDYMVLLQKNSLYIVILTNANNMKFQRSLRSNESIHLTNFNKFNKDIYFIEQLIPNLQ
jgi:hypothetical protein